MTLTNPNPVIGTQVFKATLQPKLGDREDFLLRVQGPGSTDYVVPLTVSGTALAVWGNPDPIQVAETLGAAVFHQIGTASPSPQQGFWFDSYNSGEDVKGTISKIYNNLTPFLKNSNEALFINGLDSKINEKIQLLDSGYTKKYGAYFFKSLEDLSEESQRVNDLITPAKDNANYLYRVSILSGIIDHINVRLSPEDAHICTHCGQRHKPTEGSIQAFKRWLAVNLNDKKATDLTKTFQMIKYLRKQYPIHDHYENIEGIREVRKNIMEANEYFGITKDDYGHNAAVVITKFSDALHKIIQELAL